MGEGVGLPEKEVGTQTGVPWHDWNRGIMPPAYNSQILVSISEGGDCCERDRNAVMRPRIMTAE
jgi:hypothetical protein